MGTRVAIDGTADGQYTVRDLRVFLETWDHLGMPDDARIHAKTKITGSGPLKTLTAEYEGTGAAGPAAVQPRPNTELRAPVQMNWPPNTPTVAMPRPETPTERLPRIPSDEEPPTG
jgi:hypothetical protein